MIQTMNNADIKAIIFDFDGTLINTNDLIVEGLDRFAMTFRGCSLSHEEHQILAGKPLDDQMTYICAEKAEDMAAVFKGWYMEAHKTLAKPFEGVAELFEFFRNSHYKLAIVSNNSHVIVKMGLEQLGLSDYFDLVICCEDVKNRKPSPEGLNKALVQLGLEKEEVIFVGDSGNDLMAARAARITSVLVGWTALERERLLQLAPNFVIEHPLELLQLIGILETLTA